MSEVIEFGELPQSRRYLKWERALLEVMRDCPEGEWGLIAVKPTRQAANGLRRTLHQTAKRSDDIDVDVSVRMTGEDEYEVWATPRSRQ